MASFRKARNAAFGRNTKRFRAIRSLAVRAGLLGSTWLASTACGDDAERPSTAAAGSVVLVPAIETFAVYARTSVQLRDRARVLGGNVGVERASSGPFLFNGFEVALDIDARVDQAFGLYGDSVRLDARAIAGNVYTNQLVHFGATFGPVNAFQQQGPLPPTPLIQPGTEAVVVDAGGSSSLAAGRYGLVTVAGRLTLSGGIFEFGGLTVDNDARIEALAPSEIRVQGRVAFRDRAFIGPALGTALTARQVLLTAAGGNGGSGGPAATPAAIAAGNDATLRALVFAPNGTFSSGQRTRLDGSVIARDALIDLDALVSFEGGFSICNPASCVDTNPCTSDVCQFNECAHVPVAAGTACADADLCNGNETCNASGNCTAGAPPVHDDENPCTDDSCDPELGVRHEPVAEGTACGEGADPCREADGCDGSGLCRMGMPIDTDDVNPCTEDSCDPVLGPVHVAIPPGTSCADDDICNGPEICTNDAACVGYPPEPPPSECTEPPPDSEFCGDGIRDPVTEECDDGPGLEEDSCAADCRIHDIFVRPVTSPGGLRQRSRSLGFGRHPVAAGSTATVAAFVESENSAFSLKAALFDHQGRRTGLLDLGATARPSEFADAVVASVPQGGFVAAWGDLGNGSLDIALRRIEPVSTPMLGDVVHANTTLAGVQQDPDLVWTGAELVVAWTDESVIKARRFFPDLSSLSAEQALSPADEMSGAVALARFGASWAAAWRALEASEDEIIRVRAGANSWAVGPFPSGAGLERPALVELDSTHLFVAFTEGTDPLETGTPSVSRLRGAILDTAGGVQVAPLEPLLQPYADETLSLGRPTLVRVGIRLFLGWQSEGILGDPLASELWVQELSWNAASATLVRGVEQPVQVDAPRNGNQFVPAFAGSALIPQGALVTVWEEHATEARHETLPDIVFGLRPAPFVFLPGGGG